MDIQDPVMFKESHCSVVARAHTSTLSSVSLHSSSGSVSGGPVRRIPAARPPATMMTRVSVASASTRAQRADIVTTSPRAPENRQEVLADRTPRGRENFINHTEPPVSRASPEVAAHVTRNIPHMSPPSVMRLSIVPCVLSYWHISPLANPASSLDPSLL